MLPSAGGPYEFVSVAAQSMGRVGDVVSFLFAWSFMLLDSSAVAIHALTFTSYALSVVYNACTPPYVVTALVTVGVTEPALLNKFTFDGSTTPVKVVESFAVAMFSCSGSTMIACMAEEMSDPSRIIPRSLLGGVSLVTTLLVFTNAAYFSVLDLQVLTESEATAVTFARATWGAAGAYLVPAIVCVCTFGTMSACGMLVCCAMITLEMAAMLRLRFTMKEAHRPIRAPTWLILVNIAVSLTIVLVPVMAAGEVLPYVIAIGFTLTGFPAYFVLKAVQRSNRGIKVDRFLQKLTLGVPCVRN
ncbi:hypothetical protein MTO96_048897 [Rhipicephalus appendiculatus]